MYFEHGGEMCAGSSVEKGASYKALERRFGAWDADRDAGVFRAAEVAGVGRVAAPGRSGGATLEASVARAKAAGWEVEVAPREASGWVQSAVRARDGRTWIVIANGEPSADPPRSPKAFYVPATSGDSPGPGARVRVREGRIEAIAKTRRHAGRKWETSAGEGEARGGGVPREEVRHRRALERDAVRPVSQSKSLAPMARSGGAPCVDVKDKSGALMSAAALRERMNRQGDRWSVARSGEPVRATIMERDVRVEEGRFALAVARDHGVTMVPYSAGLEAARGRDVLVSRNERGATRVEPAPARAPSPRGGAPRGSARREERDARSGLGGDAGARVPASEPAKPLRRWCQEESQRTGREVAPLRPSRSAVGTLSERDLNLKEGRFSVITRDDGSRALVKYAPELEAHRGERISVVRAVSGHALDVKAGPEREGGLGRGMDR